MGEAIKANTVKAENQIKKDQMTFYIGNPEAKTRIAIVGNSITRHGIKEDIGWTRLCGMAASDEEHDYVHVLYKMLCDDNKDVYMMVNQLSYWECNYSNNILENYDDIRDFKPDYFIFRLGENIVNERLDSSLYDHVLAFYDYFKSENTKMIFTTCFWDNKPVDDVIKRVSEEKGCKLVELRELGYMDEMMAKGLFEHSGVAAHPGDLGMETIAKRIYEAIK